ncbi:Hypoxia induced protein [Senna tora]|uniref:Hypoxia induced protein n=1 Tax=Senna tora TaxID=362788 RepID=A0A834T9B1_9FABA|nr:Hypoxia induced protein [Senna tora]
MEAIQTWVADHKLTSIGALWASGIGASLVAYSRTRSPMKPSLRLIHARMHAQALTLAVLSGAAAHHYYHNRMPNADPNPLKAQIESEASDVTLQWELLSPF